MTVTVFDETGPGAGASWGNAGWITPTLSTPLPEPSMLAHGLRAMMSSTSPLYVPLTVDPGLWRFLLRLARNCAAARWRRQDGRDQPTGVGRFRCDGGWRGRWPHQRGRPVYLRLHRSARCAEHGRRVAEAHDARPAGRRPGPARKTGARTCTDALGEIRSTVVLDGQRFLDPPAFVAALADSVVARGGDLRAGVQVTGVSDSGPCVRVLGTGVDETFDAVVLANGMSLSELAAPLGVRMPIRAARGYSFSVAAENAPEAPIYFPGASAVCTPIGGRVRVAGMMEFRRHGAPIDPRRIAAVVESVRPLVRGLDLDNRQDEWVGSRPCTADGLPLAGATHSPRVFVAGGHAMEGMTLGPATGRLVAEAVTTSDTPSALAGFDPLR